MRLLHTMLRVGNLENGLACTDLDQHKVECFGNTGVRQFATEQALHDLQTGLAGHLIRLSHAGPSACIHALAHHLFLGQPIL